jgi:hypothetical protein
MLNISTPNLCLVENCSDVSSVRDFVNGPVSIHDVFINGNASFSTVMLSIMSVDANGSISIYGPLHVRSCSHASLLERTNGPFSCFVIRVQSSSGGCGIIHDMTILLTDPLAIILPTLSFIYVVPRGHIPHCNIASTYRLET